MTDTKTDITKKSFQTSEELFGHDSQLSTVDKKWGTAASAESVEKAAKALEAKKYKVDVVANKEAALKLLTSLSLKDKSIYVAGSTSFQQVGFVDFLRDAKDYAKRNIKGEVVAAQHAGDQAKAGALMREGQSADVFFSSVPAIAETGEIHVVCASGTRTGGFVHSAGQLVILAGANKIVPDLATALKRTREYALPLESARARIAYAAWGVKGSQITYEATLHGESPFAGTSRVHVILIKEALGF